MSKRNVAHIGFEIVRSAAIVYLRSTSILFNPGTETKVNATSPDLLMLRREAHLFAKRPGLMEKMETERESIAMASDQLLHPAVPRDHIVRRGKLRVTQFMPDGREITRAVLQAGAVFLTRTADGRQADPQSDRYLVSHLVLMALGEVELWTLPAGALEQTE